MDIKSFKNSFLPHGKKLYCMALKIVGDSSEAEDLVQETFAKLWSQCDRLGEVSNPEAFLVTALKHACIDFVRQHRESSLALEEAGRIVSREASVTERLQYAEDLSSITQLMKTLPEQQQTVIRLRAFGDYTIEEIEQATGLSNINVRTLLSRARKRLRQLYRMDFNKQ